jgi:TP901 family phage tail tape measure protein
MYIPMSVRTDVINLQVNINGNDAQNNLNELRKKAKDIAFEMEGLKKGTQAYIDKKKELSGVTAEMDNLKKQIGITALSQKELVAELGKLKALQGSTIPFSKEYKDFAKQIKEVDNRLYDVRNGVQGFSSFFSKIKDEVKQFGAVAVGYSGFQFLSSQFSNIIQGSAKLSDQLADLRRVSGFTQQGAEALNSSLSKLDTRTAVGSLRDIAIIAGKLGVAKEDILGFTEATDKLVVSLGDELGNADQITTQLGKILNVFDGKVNGDNITRLGNSFVTLANAGVASGGFIAEFDQRLASVAKSAGIGLGELSGLGAGLEELGGKVESSSTAFQKLLGTISADIPAAAKIAGVSTEAFRKLFNEDAIGASLKYSAALVKNKSSLEEVTKSLQGAGEDGARTINLINTLGQKSEFLAEKVKIGADSLKESSQITEAFALKNENFGASLDKLGKQFNSFVSSPAIVNFLQGAVQGLSNFLKVLGSVPQFIKENTLAFQLLTAGIILLNRQYIVSALVIIRDTTLKVANAIATRAVTIATALAEVAQASYITVVTLLSGRITLATAAQRLWSFALSLGAGPLGIIISLIGAAVIAFNALIGKTQTLTAAQRAQLDVQAKITEYTKDEEQAARSLFNQITKGNLGYDEKKKLLADLIKLNPEYLKGLTLENIKTEEGIKILDNYILKLREQNREKARAKVIQEKEDKIVDIENSLKDKSVEVKNSRGEIVGREIKNKDNSFLGAVKSIFTENEVSVFQDKKAELASLKSEVNALYTEVKNAIATSSEKEKNQDTNIDSTSSATKEEIKAAETERKRKAKEEADKLEQLRKDAAAFAAELKKLRAKAEQGTLSEDDRERAQIEEKYAELIARAKLYWAQNTTLGKQASADIIAIRDAQLAALNKKIFERDGAKEYEESLRLSNEFYDQKKVKAQQDFVSGKISKQAYELELTAIEIDAATNRLIIAQDYSASVEKAAKDVTTFKRTQLDKQTADAVAAAERQKKLTVDDQLAAAKLAVISKPKNSDARLEAEKNYLKLKYELTEKNENDTQAMRELKERELQDKLDELDNQRLQTRIDNAFKYIEAFQQAINSLNTILSNRENRELQRDKAINDRKRSNYKSQLDNKLISKEQYDSKLDKLNLEQERKEKEIKLRQARREKALGIFAAIINTAQAVTAALTAKPWTPANFTFAAIAGILGGLQIATAASAPLPELGRGGHLGNGPKHSHSSRGLHVVNPLTGKTEMLLEQNEAVINSNAIDSNRRMTVTGTPKQIASAINSSHGGVSFASGAIISAGWFNQRPATIKPGIVRMMAQGGIVGNTSNSGELGELSLAQLQALQDVVASNEAMRADIKNFNTNLKAYVVFKEVQASANTLDQVKKASGF